MPVLEKVFSGRSAMTAAARLYFMAVRRKAGHMKQEDGKAQASSDVMLEPRNHIAAGH